MAGGVLSFAFVGVLAFGGVVNNYSQERSQALLWGSFHFLSIGLSIGGAKLVPHYARILSPGRSQASSPRPPISSLWEPSLPSHICGTTGEKGDTFQSLPLGERVSVTGS